MIPTDMEAKNVSTVVFLASVAIRFQKNAVQTIEDNKLESIRYHQAKIIGASYLISQSHTQFATVTHSLPRLGRSNITFGTFSWNMADWFNILMHTVC